MSRRLAGSKTKFCTSGKTGIALTAIMRLAVPNAARMQQALELIRRWLLENADNRPVLEHRLALVRHGINWCGSYQLKAIWHGKRVAGFVDHSSGQGVQNTFVHDVGAVFKEVLEELLERQARSAESVPARRHDACLSKHRSSEVSEGLLF